MYDDWHFECWNFEQIAWTAHGMRWKSFRQKKKMREENVFPPSIGYAFVWAQHGWRSETVVLDGIRNLPLKFIRHTCYKRYNVRRDTNHRKENNHESRVCASFALANLKNCNKDQIKLYNERIIIHFIHNFVSNQFELIVPFTQQQWVIYFSSHLTCIQYYIKLINQSEEEFWRDAFCH